MFKKTLCSAVKYPLIITDFGKATGNGWHGQTCLSVFPFFARWQGAFINAHDSNHWSAREFFPHFALTFFARTNTSGLMNIFGQLFKWANRFYMLLAWLDARITPRSLAAVLLIKAKKNQPWYFMKKFTVFCNHWIISLHLMIPWIKSLTNFHSSW